MPPAAAAAAAAAAAEAEAEAAVGNVMQLVRQPMAGGQSVVPVCRRSTARLLSNNEPSKPLQPLACQHPQPHGAPTSSGCPRKQPHPPSEHGSFNARTCAWRQRSTKRRAWRPLVKHLLPGCEGGHDTSKPQPKPDLGGCQVQPTNSVESLHMMQSQSTVAAARHRSPCQVTGILVRSNQPTNSVKLLHAHTGPGCGGSHPAATMWPLQLHSARRA
jgi:hypothetical protein